MGGTHTGSQKVSHSLTRQSAYRARGKGFGVGEGPISHFFFFFLPHKKHLGLKAVYSDSVLDESQGSKAESIFFRMAALPVSQH